MNEATDITGPNLLQQYGCGPIRFSGHQDALHEGICSSTMSLTRLLPEHASGSRPLLDRSQMCCPSAGCRPSASMIRRTRSAPIICRWNF
jgi:hypothetical protein